MKTSILKIIKYLSHPFAIFFYYLIIAGILVWTIDYYPKSAMEGFLMRALPWTLLFNLLLIIITLILCGKGIAGFLKNLFVADLNKINRQGIWLALIVILAFVMVTFVAPRTHRIFFDEDIYANIGQNIALTGQAGMASYGEFFHGEYKANWLSYNKEPGGWPFLISVAFQLCGVNELAAFILNNLFFTAAVFLIFLITLEITGAYSPALLAAFIFSLIPHNIIWANTAAAEPAAAFFTLFSLLCLTIYLKTTEARQLFLLAAVLPFSCQMRPESILIIPLAFIALAMFRRELFFKKQLWATGLLTFLLLLPHLLHFYAVGNNSWGAAGARFSWEFFRNNIIVNGPYYFNNEWFPLLFTLAAVIGFILTKYSLKWRYFIFLWFTAFWGIFLFFYAGSYRYGADVRFALLSFAPLAILAGFGLDWIRNKLVELLPGGSAAALIIVVILLVSWIRFLPLIRNIGQEAWEARADHSLTREFIKKIPERSIVVTHVPTMILLWQQSAISVDALKDRALMANLINKYDGNVYFHYNYWCHTASDTNSRVCGEVKKNFALEEIAADKSLGRLYGLYRIRMREDKTDK